jgi:hypothetical protein
MKKLLFLAMFLYGTVYAQRTITCDAIRFYTKAPGQSSYTYDGTLDKLTMFFVPEPFNYIELITTNGITRYDVMDTIVSGSSVFYTVMNKESRNVYDVTLTDIQVVFFNVEDGADKMMSFKIKD